MDARVQLNFLHRLHRAINSKMPECGQGLMPFANVGQTFSCLSDNGCPYSNGQQDAASID